MNYSEVLTQKKVEFDEKGVAAAEWATVKYDGEKFSVSFSACECPVRELEIVFNDGSDAGGDIRLIQRRD